LNIVDDGNQYFLFYTSSIVEITDHWESFQLPHPDDYTSITNGQMIYLCKEIESRSWSTRIRYVCMIRHMNIVFIDHPKLNILLRFDLNNTIYISVREYDDIKEWIQIPSAAAIESLERILHEYKIKYID
jgi:hypothetical protein